MSTDEALGSVPICRKGRKGLYTDDLGVMVRSSASRTERFAWAEISHFADGGGQADAQSGGGYYWMLVIVLHTGREIPVDCTTTWEKGPTPDTIAAIRQAAERYGIPADLAGIPMKNGKPLIPISTRTPAARPACGTGMARNGRRFCRPTFASQGL
jgi:hypothetical protein